MAEMTRATVERALGDLFLAWTTEGHVVVEAFFDDVARRLPEFGVTDIRVVGPWRRPSEQGDLLGAPDGPDGIVYALDPIPLGGDRG